MGGFTRIRVVLILGFCSFHKTKMIRKVIGFIIAVLGVIIYYTSGHTRDYSRREARYH